MERGVLLQHLAQAEAHVAQGRELIVRQHRLIAELAAKGRATDAAEQLLWQLEDMQERHEAHRHRLLTELAG